MSGYLHKQYAQSLSEFGTPCFLPESKGWVLSRYIPGFPENDLMGCYPLFCCHDWSRLYLDIKNLKSDVISLSLVTDPFGSYNDIDLRRIFSDVFFLYKLHFVIDLSRIKTEFISQHHQRNAKKALKVLQIKKSEELNNLLSFWYKLYSNLVQRHNIEGIAKFSEKSFIKQFQVPGLVALEASYQNEIIGVILWYVQDNIGYYHLGAYSDLGYKLKASFALFWQAIDYFADLGLRWLNIGAGAGINQNHLDGLSRFKKGWSTGTKPVYFCGQIFDVEKYYNILNTKNIQKTTYFPAYRVGEFV